MTTENTIQTDTEFYDTFDDIDTLRRECVTLSRQRRRWMASLQEEKDNCDKLNASLTVYRNRCRLLAQELNENSQSNYNAAGISEDLLG